MRRFLRWFRPRYQVHGHIHLYDRSVPNTVRFIDTDVINVYPYQRLDLVFDCYGSTEAAAPTPAAPSRSASGVEQQP